MKLQQLKYICAVKKHGLNVSATAESLFTSQPGISKQIRMLEEELGVQIFSRSGKHLIDITPPGENILRIAEKILQQTESIKAIAHEFASPDKGVLRIGTTHTQARFVLPEVIKSFINKYPNVSLQMHQGTPKQIAEFVANGEVDIAIATDQLQHFNNLLMLPCYLWNRCIVVPKDHPLAKSEQISIEQLAQYPLITYVYGFTGRSKLDKAFSKKRLTPNVIFSATDADVIKTYVRLGLGVGIIASMAYNAEFDKELVGIEASHLFEPNIANIGFHKNIFFRDYMFQFIELFAPHLTKSLVIEAAKCSDDESIQQLFMNLDLPTR
ncbi:MAG: HTH-type transcriptional regulator CysB [Gammaproteobacteria bacterium CG22_combo_CG10-13_8_21_14_all_40_8]|nr:MAG: HTH-type transcriptional regulator CysB [Gammaproteobacteria bacterium CG22_combo_CG10-13_8_21_14_all_40_8]